MWRSVAMDLTLADAQNWSSHPTPKSCLPSIAQGRTDPSGNGFPALAAATAAVFEACSAYLLHTRYGDDERHRRAPNERRKTGTSKRSAPRTSHRSGLCSGDTAARRMMSQAANLISGAFGFCAYPNRQHSVRIPAVRLEFCGSSRAITFRGF